MTRGPKPNTERNMEICDMLSTGKTLQEVGEMYGISRQRVEKIAKRHGLSKMDFGIAVKTKIKFDAKDAAHRHRFGVGIQEYNFRRNINPELFRRQREIFLRKRQNIRRDRSKIWDLKFGDVNFPMVCPVSGQYLDYFSKDKGPKTPSFYVKIPELGFIPGNVEIVSLGALRHRMSREGRIGAPAHTRKEAQ